jgi:hypothetical protein
MNPASRLRETQGGPLGLLGFNQVLVGLLGSVGSLEL